VALIVILTNAFCEAKNLGGPRARSRVWPHPYTSARNGIVELESATYAYRTGSY